MPDINWNDPAWVAIAVSLLALIMSIVSAAQSWKSLLWERQNAEAAIRSAEAAERANRLTERLLDRELAQLAKQQIEPTGIPPEEAFGTPTVMQEPPNVSWQIEHPRGNRYILRNTGTDVADHVQVEELPQGVITRHLPSDAVIRPGEGVDMIIVGTWGSPVPNQLYVRWAGRPDGIAVPITS